VAEQPSLSFAGLLRQLRAEAKLTQEELAEAAGLSPRSVSDLERGVNRTARRDTALLLAGALGLTGPAGELFVAAARGRAPAAAALAAADGGRAQRGGTGSPYRGLSVFGERDAPFFFGREAAAAQVLDRMARLLTGAGLLVVSGVSGAGKSSLLRAGVLPRLRAAGLAGAPGAASWPCLVFTPTRAPLDELALQVAVPTGADAAAVRRELEAHPEGFALTARQAATPRTRGPVEGPGAARDQWQRRLLLVVDQFEELFTQCAEEGQRRSFITALHAAAATAHGPGQAPAALVVLGVRADFEARCADYPQLAGAVQDRYLVTAMTERQLRMAITEPAKKAGSQIDEDLVEVLLTEVRTGQHRAFGAGVLPLLSHALDQSWRCRTGETATLADYERAGGIEGAVASSAQRLYERLTPGQQAAARQVFTRLAAISGEGADTADRATRAELTEGKNAAEAQDVELVLEAFTAERLLTLAAGTVELAHEVLLTAWPLLRDTWLADSHADRIVRTRLHTTAADWARHSCDPSYLYSGSLLQAATDTAARIAADPAHHPPLSQTEREFLHASTRAHRRRARRRRAFLAFLLALVVGLASATVLAVRASQQAAHQRDIAISGQLISQSQLLHDTNPALSKLESVAAWRLNPSSQARYAMLAAVARPGIALLTSHTTSVLSVEFSPNSQILASGNFDGSVQLWNVATGRPIGHPLTGHLGPLDSAYSVAFSPDGNTVASGNDYGTVLLWNVATGRQIGRLFIAHHTTHSYSFMSVAFSPDGKTLAAINNNGSSVLLWNVATGRPIGHTGAGFVAFSPDGKTAASVSADGTLRLSDVATGRPTGHPLHTGFVFPVAFGPEDKTLATADINGTVQLWDVATGRPIGHPFTGHAGPVGSLAFSPNGKTLASGNDDGTIQLWDTATQQPLAAFTGHTGPVGSLAFSPNGKTLASGSLDGTRLWELATQVPVIARTGRTGPVGSVAFSPNGKTLASGSQDGTIRLWATATGRPIGHPLVGHSGPVGSVAFSPNGKTLADSSFDDTIRLWAVDDGRQIGHPLTDPSGPGPVTFSPDGKTLAAGNADGTVRLWDVATGRPVGHPLTGFSSPVTSLAFSPSSKTLAGGNDYGTVLFWDVATGRQIGRRLATSQTGGSSTVNAMAFSPDGKTLASASADGVIRLWEVATHLQKGNPLIGYDGSVGSIAFSPDGKALASLGADGVIRLWDMATQQQITALTGLTSPALPGQPGPVSVVAFSPDGKTLASASADHTVQLWDVSYLVDVVPYLCAMASRSFTPAEWARYVPLGPAYEKVCP
jgi:WD40 repeat protein/transcriptional regulator with XRE-family HTH domain